MSFTENRKAYFNYEIKDRFEAGIELLGLEVKSVRAGRISLDASYVILSAGEAYIIGATIQPYQAKNTPKEYDPDRTRKLLLSKRNFQNSKKFLKRKG